jgi:hypothetical protein
MTESEWVACTDSRLLLVFLEGQASDRKARLFACGLGRSLWPYLGDERSRRVVEVAEANADHLATEDELAAARGAALDAVQGAASRAAAWVGDRHPWQAARTVVIALQQAQTELSARDWSRNMSVRGRKLIDCVFGNPFRTITVDPSWLVWNHGTVLALARRIYDDRAFDTMPILGDALEDAGCTDMAILEHLRGPGPHARGCWALDLILGKE